MSSKIHIIIFRHVDYTRRNRHKIMINTSIIRSIDYISTNKRHQNSKRMIIYSDVNMIGS